MLGELVEGVPRIVLIPAGGVAVIAVLAFLFLVVLQPARPIASRQTAAPTAAPPSHNTVLNRFFHEVRDPNATFAVTMKVTITVSAGGKESVATVNGDLLLAGTDYSGTLHVAGTGMTAFDGSVVQVGQQGWARLSATAPWKHATVPAQAQSANPFQWISTVDEVTYLEAGADVDGQRTHRLETTKWLSGTEYDALALNLISPQRDSRMDVVTTDKGVPLTATYRFSVRGTMPAGAGALTLSGTADYTFDRWGDDITIQPPA